MCIQHTSIRLHGQKLPHFVYTKKNKISCPCRRRHRASISFARNESCYFYVNAIATKNACNRTSYLYIHKYICMYISLFSTLKLFQPHQTTHSAEHHTNFYSHRSSHIFSLVFKNRRIAEKKVCVRLRKARVAYRKNENIK